MPLNYTVPGGVNASGHVDFQTDNALFLKVFSGMVLETFPTKTLMRGLTMHKQIGSGKSWQFPTFGRANADYLYPGQEGEGQAIGSNEAEIFIDGLLKSDIFIFGPDEWKNHIDMRQHYARELAAALARTHDTHIMHNVIKAAQTSTSLITSEPQRVGTIIENSDLGSGDMSADPDKFVDAVFLALAALEEKDVPTEDLVLVVKPSMYYHLANASKVVNTDIAGAANGGTAVGRVSTVAGVPIYKSNLLPTEDVTSGVAAGYDPDEVSGTSYDPRHAVDARNTVGLLFHKSCVGTVVLRDVASEVEWIVRRQGTYMISKMMVGHGVLRPEAACQLRTSAPV